MNPVPQSVSNFLVPASGSTNSVVFDQTFVAGTPVVVNFAGYQISGIPFRPSGVLIDNTASANPISVTIPEIGYTMQCAAGEMLHLPYPAPINHSASISGDGAATVIFVDYPVIPYSSRFVAAIAQPIQVTVIGPDPLPVSLPAAFVQKTALAERSVLGRQTLAVTTGAVATLTVPANAKAAEIQADGYSVSITLDGTTAPTATVGTRIDDGQIYAVYSTLANVKLIARTNNTNVQVVYFDK